MINHFYTNGYLIVSPRTSSEINYQGVYGITWPLEDHVSEYNTNFLDELGLKMYLFGVEVATIWETTKLYLELCLENGIEAYLLLLETKIPHPFIAVENPKDWKFIGFDYAYIGGDFYSAIQQELIMPKQPPDCISHWKNSLNNFGLFTTHNEVEAFRRERSLCKEDIEFSGDFYIIKVSIYHGSKLT